MSKLTPFLNSTFHHGSALGRRNFLQNAGKSLLVATLLPAKEIIGKRANYSSAGGDPIKVELPPLEQASEQEQAVSTVMLEPGKRIGFAVVGLGNLSLGQILPAFGACKFARLAALVSGSPDKAQKVAAQYGVDSKNVYSYKNFDELKNNP